MFVALGAVELVGGDVAVGSVRGTVFLFELAPRLLKSLAVLVGQKAVQGETAERVFAFPPPSEQAAFRSRALCATNRLWPFPSSVRLHESPQRDHRACDLVLLCERRALGCLPVLVAIRIFGPSLFKSIPFLSNIPTVPK